MINFLQYYGLTAYPADNEAFCEEVILPSTIQAAKYIGLYRKLKKEGFIVNNRNENGTQNYDQEMNKDNEANGVNANESSAANASKPEDFEMAETKF